MWSAQGHVLRLLGVYFAKSGGGIGSRGGIPYGYTRTGKVIYEHEHANSDEYKHFTAKDHHDAAVEHHEDAKVYRDHLNEMTPQLAKIKANHNPKKKTSTKEMHLTRKIHDYKEHEALQRYLSQSHMVAHNAMGGTKK